jgi:hypothetical protein
MPDGRKWFALVEKARLEGRMAAHGFVDFLRTTLGCPPDRVRLEMYDGRAGAVHCHFNALPLKFRIAFFSCPVSLLGPPERFRQS